MSTNNISTDASANSTQVQKPASTRYSPLLHNGDSFRLLRVLPSLRQGPMIRCELFTSSISRERDQYIAGSYVWGPPEPKMTILLDGDQFQVRENLFRFLKAFRSRYQSQVIWLDAICINQDDIQERIHQVQEMKRIYSGAKCVYSWLGFDKSLPHTGIFNRQYVIDLYYRCMRDERQHTRQRDQLEYLSKAEYWSRMWIVQEFILAQDVHLLLGRHRLSYSKLKKIERDGVPFDDGRAQMTQSVHKMVALIIYRGVKWRTFEAFFGVFGILPRLLPLDGVFALLGLLEGTEDDLRLKNIVDYSLTVWQLFQKILALDILESPFRFAEQYNRYFIKEQRDDYMGGHVGLKLTQTQLIQPRGADNSRYARTEGSSMEMDTDIRPSRAIGYVEQLDERIMDPVMYTPRWRSISEQSGVSLKVMWSSGLPNPLISVYTHALVEACDSRCATTCATHAVVGFSWTVSCWPKHTHDSTPPISVDVSLLTSYASGDVSQLIHNIQKRSTEMVEAISSKVRVTAGDRFGFHTIRTPYKLETDVETIVTLSTFIKDIGTHEGWRQLFELAMDLMQKPETEEHATRPK